MNDAQVARAAQIIAAGGVVAYPTDTFYGLAVDPRLEAAVRRLFDIKGRDADRAAPLIAASLEQAEQLVEFTDAARRLAAQFWPGPLTLVLRVHGDIDPAAIGRGGTAAVRVPAHPLARALAEASGCCITATSANVSGRPPVQSPANIDARLLAHVDFLLDGGMTPGGSPSTIVDATARAPRLVRAGAIAFERVLESLQ